MLGMQIPIGGNEGTMAGTAQHSHVTGPTNRRGKHVHHGRTLAAWVGSVIGLVAFVVGGIAVVFNKLGVLRASVGFGVVARIVKVVLHRNG